MHKIETTVEVACIELFGKKSICFYQSEFVSLVRELSEVTI